MVVAAVAVALLVALAALAPRPAAARAARGHAAGTHLPPRFFGMNVDGPLLDPGAPIDAEFARIRRSHLRYVRLDFPWWYMQPRRPASRRRRVLDGDINFTYADRFVLAAARAGLRVLPIIGQATPAWVSLDPFTSPRRRVTPRPTAPSRGRSCAATAPAGTSGARSAACARSPSAAWQVWNEPDLKPYWDVTPWAPSYARLLRAGSRALHAGRPGGAGRRGRADEPQLGGPRRASTTRARGGASTPSRSTPTPRPSRGWSSSCGGRGRVMRANGDARKPLLITELGWPATVGAPSRASRSAPPRRGRSSASSARSGA